jgi:hypothetical protein
MVRLREEKDEDKPSLRILLVRLTVSLSTAPDLCLMVLLPTGVRADIPLLPDFLRVERPRLLEL